MPLYEKPVRLLMRDFAQQEVSPARPVDRAEVFEWFRSKYPLVKESTVAAHLIRMSVNAPSRLHHNIQEDGSDDLFYQIDRSTYRLFDPGNDPSPIRTSSDAAQAEEIAVSEASASTSEFAYEHDLRDYLAKNLPLIEPGLTLYRDEGVTGIEFPVGGRFVDILAVDANGRLVAVELKVSRGYDRVVGQLLRYMGWLEAHHVEQGQEVRGVIVSNEVTEDLRLACRRLKDVQLFEYELAVKLRRVL